MPENLTVTQKQRLAELNAPEETLNSSFNSREERDSFYKAWEAELSKENRKKLLNYVNKDHRPLVCELEGRLIKWLTEEEGFSQVSTPVILPRVMLDKMTITSEHPLTSQVFWLDRNRCLRPMLAPNLYEMMRELQRVTRQPVKIFESGPCFRKETQGAQHMNEFTMLNFVELATVPEGKQMDRLKELAAAAMKAINFEDYTMEISKSEVYGETLDIVSGDIELASGAYGPHFLDNNWGIFDTWVGIGFGLERIALAMSGFRNIKRVGRSLSYVGGARLNV